MHDRFASILGSGRGCAGSLTDPRQPSGVCGPPERPLTKAERLRLLAADIKQFGGAPVTVARMAHSRGLDAACSWLDWWPYAVPSVLVSDHTGLAGVLLVDLGKNNAKSAHPDLHAVESVLIFAVATVLHL